MHLRAFISAAALVTLLVVHHACRDQATSPQLPVAPADIVRFIASEYPDATLATRVLLAVSADSIVVFEAANGGYWVARGLRRASKIGWVAIRATYPSDNHYSSFGDARFYPFDSTDAVLLSEGFVDLLKSKAGEFYFTGYAQALSRCSDTPRALLLMLANDLHTGQTNWSVAEGLVDNPRVVSDRVILTLLATLPMPEGDPYLAVRQRALDLLVALGPE